MKIAILSIYSGEVKRGVESFVDEIAREFVSKKNSVSLYQNGKPDGSETYQVKRINVFGSWPKDMTDTWQRKLFIDFYSLKILQFTLIALKLLWGEKPDIIIPSNGFWQTLIIRLYTFLFGGKEVIVGHSGPGYDERWNLYFKPDVFIATTPSVEEWAKKVCFYTRVELIPYGINIKKYRNAKPIHLDLQKPIFLCSAAAVPYKRVDTAIRAVAKLNHGSLLHLGGGYLKDEIKKLGQSLLGPDRFLSLVVDNKDMPKYYKASDIVTLPSKAQENSPMTFLEAMAAEKTVVTTNTPRARWILGSAGVFVDPEDITSYTQALEVRIDKKIVYAQAKKYSWDIILKKYEDLLNSL